MSTNLNTNKTRYCSTIGIDGDINQRPLGSGLHSELGIVLLHAQELDKRGQWHCTIVLHTANPYSFPVMMISSCRSHTNRHCNQESRSCSSTSVSQKCSEPLLRPCQHDRWNNIALRFHFQLWTTFKFSYEGVCSTLVKRKGTQMSNMGWYWYSSLYKHVPIIMLREAIVQKIPEFYDLFSQSGGGQPDFISLIQKW